MKGSKGIGAKLYMLIGFVIVFIIAISSFTWNSINKFDEKNKKRLENTVQYTTLVDNARQVQVKFKVQVQEWKNTLLRGNDIDAFNKYYGQFTKENENVNNQIQKVKEEMSKQGMDTSIADSLLDEHAALYTKYSEAIKSYDQKNIGSYQIVDKLVTGIDRKTTETMDDLVKSIDNKVKIGTENMIKEANADREDFNKNLIYINVFGILLVVAFAAVIRVTYRGITRFINQFNRIIEDAEGGDLTVRGEVLKNDELGQITSRFNKLLEAIREVISEVKGTSEVVASSAVNITEATDELSKASEEVTYTISDVSEASQKQNDLVVRSSESVKEVTKGIHRITENTVYIEDIASSAMKAVANSSEVLKSQSEKMMITKNASESVTNVIAELSIKSKEIGTVLEFINGITEQINLLSLNASIEAARAGEAGRGFAVVANEVKKLASLSRESTEKIGKLIIGVQSDVNKAVDEVKSTKYSINEQEDSLITIDKAFREIYDSVFETSNKIKEVARDTKEINEGAILVENAMENLVEILDENSRSAEGISAATQQQTASIEEVASSMENLTNLSSNLQNLISRFKV